LLREAQNILNGIIGPVGILIFEFDQRYDEKSGNAITSRWLLNQDGLEAGGRDWIVESYPLDPDGNDTPDQGNRLGLNRLRQMNEFRQGTIDTSQLLEELFDLGGNDPSFVVPIINGNELEGCVVMCHLGFHTKPSALDKEFLNGFGQTLFKQFRGQEREDVDRQFGVLAKFLMEVINRSSSQRLNYSELAQTIGESLIQHLIGATATSSSQKEALGIRDNIFYVITRKSEFTGEIKKGEVSVYQWNSKTEIDISSSKKEVITDLIGACVKHRIASALLPKEFAKELAGQFDDAVAMYGNLLDSCNFTLGFVFVDSNKKMYFSHKKIHDLFKRLTETTKSLGILLDYRHKNLVEYEGSCNVIWADFAHEARRLIIPALNDIRGTHKSAINENNPLKDRIGNAVKSFEKVDDIIESYMNQPNRPAISPCSLIAVLRQELTDFFSKGSDSLSRWLGALPDGFENVKVPIRRNYFCSIFRNLVSNIEKRWVLNPSVKVIFEIESSSNCVSLNIKNNAVGADYDTNDGAGIGYKICEDLSGRVPIILDQNSNSGWFTYSLVFKPFSETVDGR
jgi:hypothetical protein